MDDFQYNDVQRALQKQPVKAEDGWPAVFGLDHVVRRAGRYLKPSIGKKNIVLDVPNAMLELSEEDCRKAIIDSALIGWATNVTKFLGSAPLAAVEYDWSPPEQQVNITYHYIVSVDLDEPVSGYFYSDPLAPLK